MPTNNPAVICTRGRNLLDSLAQVGPSKGSTVAQSYHNPLYSGPARVQDFVEPKKTHGRRNRVLAALCCIGGVLLVLVRLCILLDIIFPWHRG